MGGLGGLVSDPGLSYEKGDNWGNSAKTITDGMEQHGKVLTRIKVVEQPRTVRELRWGWHISTELFMAGGAPGLD